MKPEVSRFVRDVLLRGRSRVDLSGSARTVAGLPPWLLDLADQLGVERPLDVIRSDGPGAGVHGAATPGVEEKPT